MIPQRKSLFIATILTGSFLLFLVQPLIARMALPRLGGAPAVWNSAMLVYQALLLGGYAYAHALSRLTIRRQSMIHLALLLLAALTLPITLAELAPPAPGWEAAWVPLLFLMTIGPIFFVISAQAPLMQRWFAAGDDSSDPYWLYAASNIGSFAGLLAYPMLLEPNLTINEQSTSWSIGYGVLIVLVALAAYSRWTSNAVATSDDGGAQAEAIGWKRICLWLALAAVPSGLMLSTTTHLTTDIVAMPLLWVIPLGLYLLSFVFAFNENSRVGTWLTKAAPAVLLFAGGTAIIGVSDGPLTNAIISLTMLFTVSVALHRRLYDDRPGAARLTYFYLVMSAGGVFGGILNGLLAPVLFDWVWEHPLLLLSAAVLLPMNASLSWMDRLRIAPEHRRPTLLLILIVSTVMANLQYQALLAEADALALLVTLAFVGLGLLLCGSRAMFCCMLALLMIGRGGLGEITKSFEGMRDRSFFGIYTLVDAEDLGLRRLIHGTTLHGIQWQDAAKRKQPTTYYGYTSGVGLTMQAAPQLVGDNARIGAVGLGVGTLACYAKPGQSWDFFEIDPLVAEYSANGSFTFLKDCTPDAKTHLGDARLVLEDMGEDVFDILVIDAFSSDVIPLHLVTRDAFAIYDRNLEKDGVLLIHISNRYMNLAPMISALARANKMDAMMRIDPNQPENAITQSIWVALSSNPQKLVALRKASPADAWADMPEPAKRIWTDDFASVLPYLEWKNMLTN